VLPLVGPLGALARWALGSKVLFGALVALATVVVIAGGTLVGAGIAARNAAVEAAPRAVQAAAKPGAAAKPNGAAAQALGPPRAVGVGMVVTVGDREMLVKPRGTQPPEKVAMMLTLSTPKISFPWLLTEAKRRRTVEPA